MFRQASQVHDSPTRGQLLHKFAAWTSHIRLSTLALTTGVPERCDERF